MMRSAGIDEDDTAIRRRVILVTPGFSASKEDWCIPILRDFAEELGQRNDISIIALRYPGERGSYRVAGIDVASLGGGDRKGLPKVGLMVRATRAIAREARRHSADVIHAFWAHEPGAVACVAGRLAGVPVVVTLMGGELAALPEIDYGGLLATGNRKLARFSLSRADRVVAMCPAVSQAAAGWVAPSRLCRLDFGVHADRFRLDGVPPAPSLPERVRFIAVGSLVPVKGHEVLLRAFALCNRKWPGTFLDIVGEGPLQGALEDQVEKLGLGGSVRFVGSVEHSDLPGWYHQADALVLASWWEGGAPQVVDEALASGVPIIGTAVGILPELGPAARTTPVGDADALGREMELFAASAETREGMAAAATASARSLAGCVSGYERLYDSIRRGRSSLSGGSSRAGSSDKGQGPT